MPTILCHHTHTSDSNRAERAVRGHTNGIHHADYVSMVGAAPPGVDVIFTRTEHWWADPGRFERLAERVAARDGTVERFDTHAVFTVAGSRGAVINGIETSLETDNSHVTVCGLPIEERPPLRACSLEELCEIGREAAWVAPAHPRFPTLGFPDERLRRVLERAESEPFDVALGYTTGYPAVLNALARGRHTDRPVRSYGREYGVPLLPELVWHAPLPRIPSAELVDARLLNAGRRPAGVAWRDFVRPFPGAVPEPLRALAGVATPSEDDLRGLRDQTIGQLFAHPFWETFRSRS